MSASGVNTGEGGRRTDCKYLFLCVHFKDVLEAQYLAYAHVQGTLAPEKHSDRPQTVLGFF